MVVLEPDGVRLVRAASEEQKAIWKAQLLKLNLFRLVYDVLQRQPSHEVDRDFLLETLVLRLPQENCEKVFDTFIGWARFGNLFAYDEDSEMISLQ
jgi:NitT/TauT family transport system ATP-binding protein